MQPSSDELNGVSQGSNLLNYSMLEIETNSHPLYGYQP
jgi:hypothetical protein